MILILNLLFNKFTIVHDLSIMFDVNYCEENNTPHVVFNDIECVFKKVELLVF